MMPTFEDFDASHWSRVRRARQAAGLPVLPTQEINVPHWLVGRRIRWNGKFYRVVRVNRDWFRGWYFAALLVQLHNDSSVYVPVENIACHEEAILDGIHEFLNHFSLED